MNIPKKSALLVLGFIIILLFAHHEANADPTIALGTTINKSSVTYGEIGYEWGNFEINYGQLGYGQTDYGRRDVSDVYSVSHIVRPSWCVKDFCNYYRIGVARVEDAKLVGENNYRLGIGIGNNLVALEYFHFSSAGIYETNGGIDGFILKLTLPF